MTSALTRLLIAGEVIVVRGRVRDRGQGTGEKVEFNDNVLPMGRADTREFRTKKDNKAVPDKNYDI
ncbi:MAG: hypothetical protein ACFFC7_15155 [Candidatus Hermodarchaeota archaeon]